MFTKFIERLSQTQVPEDMGDHHIVWTYPEFPTFDRSKKWYITMAVAVAAMLLFAVWTMNFLFAIIVLLFVLIIVFQKYRTPAQIPVVIAEDGIQVGSSYYPYKEFGKFWFVYEPPEVKNLYIDFGKRMKRSLMIPLEKANPVDVRAILVQYIDEDLTEHNEYFDERVSRLIKFQ